MTKHHHLSLLICIVFLFIMCVDIPDTSPGDSLKIKESFEFCFKSADNKFLKVPEEMAQYISDDAYWFIFSLHQNMSKKGVIT